MAVTFTNGATVLTLAYDPQILDEPSEFKVNRSVVYSITGEPIVTEFTKSRVRTRLRLGLAYLTKADTDTLVTLLGMTGLVTITLKKEFPITATNPTSYLGTWAEDGKCWVKPRLAASLPRNENASWDALPDEMKVYHAEVELIVLRNDE